MNRLTKIGALKPKASGDIVESRIGIGFEKLDRNVFDPEKAYDKVAAIGVKWVRLQSGWARTEQEKGVYSFEWLDLIVDNLIRRGLRPWLCLCYGNGLYGEDAARVFGAVGCPPIHTEEQKTAWAKIGEYKPKKSYWALQNLCSLFAEKTEFEGNVTLQIVVHPGTEMHLVDPMDGAIYRIPENMIKDEKNDCLCLEHIPVRDYPLVLCMNGFEEQR